MNKIQFQRLSGRQLFPSLFSSRTWRAATSNFFRAECGKFPTAVQRSTVLPEMSFCLTLSLLNISGVSFGFQHRADRFLRRRRLLKKIKIRKSLAHFGWSGPLSTLCWSTLVRRVHFVCGMSKFNGKATVMSALSFELELIFRRNSIKHWELIFVDFALNIEF